MNHQTNAPTTPVEDVHSGAEALVRTLDLTGLGRQPAPMACCTRCEEPTPLISTLVFSGAEFYCLECGTHFGWLSPRPVEATPELDARYEALRAEWEAHEVDQKLHRGTGEERDAVLQWLRERSGR